MRTKDEFIAVLANLKRSAEDKDNTDHTWARNSRKKVLALFRKRFPDDTEVV
jgi:hypothetical protein